MKVIYPGSFDPPTNGHLDIINRASKVFDHIKVAVMSNPHKIPMFSVTERKEMLKEATSDLPNVEIDNFQGLLVDYVREEQVKVVIKGLRAISDFENEFQMALMNRKLASEIETIFMMTDYQFAFLSSSIIKEVVKFNGCIDGLVPEPVRRFIIKKQSEK